MAISVVMPALEMAQETGKLVSWLKKEGEQVKKGDMLLEVETDKAVVEIEAQSDGILGGVTAQDRRRRARSARRSRGCSSRARRVPQRRRATQTGADTVRPLPPPACRRSAAPAACGAGLGGWRAHLAEGAQACREHGVDISTSRDPVRAARFSPTTS